MDSNTLQRIEKYLSGKMEEGELQAFLIEMERDKSLREEVAQQAELNKIILGYRNKKLKKELLPRTTQLLENALSEKENKKKSETISTKFSPRIGWVAMAAGLFFMILSVDYFSEAINVFFEPTAKTELPKDENREEKELPKVIGPIASIQQMEEELRPPNYSFLGKTDEEIQKAKSTFQKGNYRQAIKELGGLLNEGSDLSDDKNYELTMYLGYAYYKEQEYNKAIEQFTKIPSSYTDFYKQGQWYQAFALLGKKNYSQAKSLLENIATDVSHKQQEKAQELLSLVEKEIKIHTEK